jgi:hypothetical protein
MWRRGFFGRGRRSYGSRSYGSRRRSIMPYSYGMTVLLVAGGILLILYLMGYIGT